LREELQDTHCQSLLTGHSVVDDPMRQAVLATMCETERLLHKGSDATVADIHRLTTSLHGLASRPDNLRRVTGALIEYVQRAATTTTRDRASETAASPWQLTAALMQLQAGAFQQQAEATETALEEQFALDAGMLNSGHSDPRHLDWLVGTHVRVGALALWEDGPSSGRLRIIGTYDPEGLFPGLRGAASTPKHFPPAPLIEAAEMADRGVCIVVPVGTKNRDWGLLALVGQINTSSTLETYHHWVTQLCASFEEEELQEAVRDSEERYTLASRATNDGLWEWNLQTWDFYMSERCCALLGLEPDTEAYCLARWQAQVHPQDLAQMRQGMRSAAIGKRETVNSEYRVRTADGSYRWVLARALGVRSEEGPVE